MFLRLHEEAGSAGKPFVPHNTASKGWSWDSKTGHQQSDGGGTPQCHPMQPFAW
jgi:hypothetical protein